MILQSSNANARDFCAVWFSGSTACFGFHVQHHRVAELKSVAAMLGLEEYIVPVGDHYNYLHRYLMTVEQGKGLKEFLEAL